jgi:hypothetical protein
MAPNKQKRQPKGDYPVGYCRPPAQHRFRPGQSGNPTGERNGSQVRTIADELNEIASTTVTIREGQRTRKVPLVKAILLAHGMNGAKGDARSAALFLNQVRKMGLLDDQVSGEIRTGAANKPRPSDALLQNVDPSLLSREEQVELSNLALKIDGAGDVWALSTGELERVRELVNNGRGKDITQH